MHTTTYHLLRQLHARHGPRAFGKICQKFVALAFRHGGCDHVVERGVQGVDVDAAWSPDQKYATEVKTTENSSVAFMQKDAEGLASRMKDGYQPLLGVLRLSPLSSWFLVDATNLKAKNWRLEALRPYRCLNLETQLRPLFDGVVEKYFTGTLSGSQTFLDRIMRQHGIDVTDPNYRNE
jgi:hypothetical protein